MESSYSRSVSNTISDYNYPQTLLTLLSVVFAPAGIYRFGGISEVRIIWLNYTLTAPLVRAPHLLELNRRDQRRIRDSATPRE